MPRPAPRTIHDGRFKGLNQLEPASPLAPQWLADCSNIELIRGVIRPRRGYTKFAAADLSGKNPTGDVFGFAHHPKSPGSSQIPLLMFFTRDESVDSQARAWFYLNGSTITEITYGSSPSAWSWSSQLSFDNRPSYVVAGEWTLLAQAATTVKAFAPSFGTLTNPFRLAGLQAPADTPDLDPPTAGGSLSPDCTYSYKHTYYDTNTKLESNGGPESAESAVTSGGNQTINFAWLCPANAYNLGPSGLPTDLFANRVRIYRKKLSPSVEDDWTFVAEVPINQGYSGGVSQWDDTVADDARIVGKTPPTRHGVPPGTAFIAAGGDRTYYLPHNTNRVYFSEPTQLDEASSGGRVGSEYVDEFSFFDLQTAGRTTGAAYVGNALLVFQRDKVTTVDPSALPEEPFRRQITGAPGTVSHWTIAVSMATAEKPARVFWLSDVGVHEYDGVSARVISEEILNEIDELNITGFTSPWDAFAPLGLYDSLNRRYILYHGKRAESPNVNRALVYSLDTDGWVKWVHPTADLVLAAIAMPEDSTGQPAIWFGIENFALARLHRTVSGGTSYTDGGTSIAWSFKTGNIDLGDPVSKKHLQDVILACQPNTPGTTTGTISLYPDGEAAALKTHSEAITKDFGMHAGFECQRVAVGVNGTTTGITHDWSLVSIMRNCDPRRRPRG